METKPRKQHERLRTRGHGMNLNQANESSTMDDEESNRIRVMGHD